MKRKDGALQTSEPGLRLLVDRKEIAAALRKLAGEINRAYAGKSLLVIGVLKGSFMFLADLIRLLKMPVEVDFMQCGSYGPGTISSGKVRVQKGIKGTLEGKEVLVVEDIIDTGLTALRIMNYLKRKRPASLRLCALANKPSRRQKQVTIDYPGMTVPDKFIVGYGLDCAEKYRNLPDMFVLEGNQRAS